MLKQCGVQAEKVALQKEVDRLQQELAAAAAEYQKDLVSLSKHLQWCTTFFIHFILKLLICMPQGP